VKVALSNWSYLLESDSVQEMCETKARDLGENLNSSEDAQMWRLISSSTGS